PVGGQDREKAIMSMEGFGRSPLLALVGAMLATTGAFSQEGEPTPLVITLDSAIEIALSSNPAVLQAENSARLSALTVEQQQRQLLPSVNLNTGTGVPYGMPSGSPDPTVTAGISANIQVGNVYSTVANLRQARLNETG